MSKKEYLSWRSGVGAFQSERAVNAKVLSWEGEREVRQWDPNTGGKARPERRGSDGVITSLD